MAYRFSVEEVLKLWSRFQTWDTDRNGCLDRNEWKQVLLNDSGDRVTPEMFDLADVRKDDTGIQFHEYVRLVGELGRKGRINAVSENSENSLTWREVWDAYEIFRAIDSDRSGFISLSELQKALPSAVTDAKKVMTSLDKSQSGRIGFAEFLQGVAKRVITLQTNTTKKQSAPSNPSPAKKQLDPLTIPQTAGTADKVSGNGRSPTTNNNNISPFSPVKKTKEVTPAEKPLTDKEKADAFKTFCLADKNQSGSISVEELQALLKKMRPSLTAPQVNRIYKIMDTDTSGQVTFDEFLRGFAALQLDVSTLPMRNLNVREQKATYEWEIPFDELVLKAKIGEGTFGVVYSGDWRGTRVAVKKLKYQKMTESVMNDFKSEVSILGKLRHPNVILFMGACTQPPNLCIVTEFLDGGSLYDAMHKRHVKFNRKQIIKMMVQAARGLNYLHLSKPRIIHRDLKSLNLLVDDFWNVKICDFGLSCIKADLGVLKEQVGTPAFMAPELLQNRPYDEKVDSYAFAMCLWELVTGEFPFSDLDWDPLVKAVVKENKRPPIPATCPREVGDIIQSCWQTDPAKRLSIAQLLASLEALSQ
mmetsp:Transcript_25791/g.42345  ORF Transcript_25791/g.42345 Transcript_25791/m.42345 type:complete len:588 (-) Transcript_25791:400-2163(-)|eukprot:CAMPEP_0184671798 /NCGR_PEP_ID=MMETSP0308-20130426/85714_1 /TAXON_ID=38269 /ORGANISM="Gloeochaete witrockiana, Strain SAG 46.84" /LENGTH=587 /DNA_ID=CAMNT_0027118995 /DNA_START=66 /DNA_END=1829 /DNA_ORIENTATION=+